MAVWEKYTNFSVGPFIIGNEVPVPSRLSTIYIIGSLRNPGVPVLQTELTKLGFEAFADWYGAGPEADDYWQKYQKGRGHGYIEALKSPGAQSVFNFDKRHLDECDLAVMLMPAGKSGHLELGYIRGKGKPGYILMDKEPDRYDVMYNFATGVFFDKQEFFEELKQYL